VKDEGRGFDLNKIADRAASKNTGAVHGRGIYLMKSPMDVRFEEGGAVVYMRKSAGEPSAKETRK
jgi:hypothetical protein